MKLKGLIITLRYLESVPVDMDYPVIQQDGKRVASCAIAFARPGERDKFISELLKSIPRSTLLDMSPKK